MGRVHLQLDWEIMIGIKCGGGMRKHSFIFLKYIIMLNVSGKMIIPQI